MAETNTMSPGCVFVPNSAQRKPSTTPTTWGGYRYGRNEHHESWLRFRPQQCPTEALDHPDQRVKPVEGLPHGVLVQQTAGIRDGGGKHPELGDERDHVADIAILHVHHPILDVCHPHRVF